MTQVRETDRPATTAPELGVLRDLFERLHAERIRYCHWKSNEHLDASMTGATDVDVLIDRSAMVAFTRILGETNFKRFVVKPGRGYPGIEDYVGFDVKTGTLTHLHVHYQLTLGEKFLKGHRLPWEAVYLDTRVWDEQHGIYVTDPNLESIVLVVRAVMKLRARDHVLEAMGKPYFRGGMLRELRWLADRVEPQRLLQLGSRLVGERAACLLPQMLAVAQPSIRQLRAFRRCAAPGLHEYLLYGRLDAVRRMTMREWGIIWWKLRNWLLGAPTKSTRTLPQGGLFVAFLGADGAGKSTLTRQIAEWLSSEVAVVTTYGGSGKGTASLPRRILQDIARFRRRLARTTTPPTDGRHCPDQEPSRLRALGRLVWVLTLTRERRRRATQVWRARGRAMIVLSDRLPQRQFVGLNDGPQLAQGLNGRPGLRRALARREEAAFRRAELTPPDLVVKLHVSTEVAWQRRPETPAELLRTGIQVVRELQFPPTTRVVDMDAEQPLAEVLLQVKRAIWECI